MDGLIDRSQSAFVPGRLINDNIILSNELVKGYGRKNVSPRCMLKVDMKKAYDSIEWAYLKQILVHFQFLDRFVEWIYQCISTVSYSILINGQPSAPFQAKKGLRQGDPMMHTVQLSFADDLLLFSRGDTGSIKLLYGQFLEFSAASGLVANNDKSSIYFGGVPSEVQEEILQELGFSQGVGLLDFSHMQEELNSSKVCYSQSKFSGLRKILQAAKYFALAGWNENNVQQIDVFSIKQLYLKLRGDYQKVEWRRLICNNATCPKRIFILYLTLHNRLLTKKRLTGWSCVDYVDCVLCASEEESTSHLFFSCPYSKQIWQKVLFWLNINRQACKWEDETKWATNHCKGKLPHAEVYRMTLASTVYDIWQERNNKNFKKTLEKV
ncbi:uncharacterized protein LOC132628555 [Lycium barbarum]|uniref:uncharacterized protein LOC132628555 n=1 Tax=Lycium barbarum TaxID=112863 RepID=UPI00293F4107|nr:uncharacterized protein LOC132628555 [Lycium barbarum]